MSTRHDPERWALRVGGALVLAIGVGHAFMPTLGYPPSASEGMTPATQDHFYFLGTYAIGTFLLGLAALTFIHSTRPQDSQTLAFSVVMTAVWTARVGLEFAYPVDVPIFLLQRPHAIVTPVLITIAATYATAGLAGAARRTRTRHKATSPSSA